MQTVRCNLCKHPARLEIDSMLLENNKPLTEIRQWCLDNYPDDAVPNTTGFSRHRIEHLKLEIALQPNSLSIRDGQVIDATGRPLETVNISTALKTLLTLGIRNIMMYPEKVTVKDTIEVLKIMRSLGESEGDLEEFFNMWASTVVSTESKGKKKKKAPIEAEVITGTDDDPWAEVNGN